MEHNIHRFERCDHLLWNRQMSNLSAPTFGPESSKNDRSTAQHSDWTASGYQCEPAPLALFRRNLLGRYRSLDLVKYVNRYLAHGQVRPLILQRIAKIL